MVVNEFGDFDEGPELLDLYFGGNRPPLLLNAVYVGIFYATSLLLALYFLQPRGSRLRVLKENPTLLSRERLSVAALGGRADPDPGAPRPPRSAAPPSPTSEQPPALPPPPPPPPRPPQTQQQQEQMRRLQEMTTAALQPEALEADAKNREYYSAFETASAGVGAVVTGGGGGVFKRGGWPGGWGVGVPGLRDRRRGEEAKEAGRGGGGGGGIMTGRLRKSSRASVSSSTFAAFRLDRGNAWSRKIGLLQQREFFIYNEEYWRVLELQSVCDLTDLKMIDRSPLSFEVCFLFLAD